MKPDEFCETALAICRRLGANDIVVTVFENKENMVRFSNDMITVVNSLDEVSGNIFLCLGRRKAAINVVDLSMRGLEKACRQAVEMASNTPESDLYAPLPKGPFTYDRTLTRIRKVSGDPEQAVQWVQEAVAEAKKAGAHRTAGSLVVRNTVSRLATSGDVRGVAHSTGLEISVRAFGEGLASGHSLSVSADEKGFDPGAAGREAGELAKSAKDAVKGSPGVMDAIMGPMVFADIVSQVGRFASAFYVDAGLSFLTNKIGQQVASPDLDLFEDATDPSAYGAKPFDAEGLPTRSKALIEKGVLRTFLHNSATASKFKTESTANAGIIVPAPFCLQVGPGKARLSEMISQVDRGIYVTNDWYLRYQNYSTGDFSAIPRDAMFLIENGEIVASLRELRISDNVLGLLQRVRSMSKERKWVKWWEVRTPILTPTALVGGVHFTASSQ
jgi:PmbA protein